MTTVRVVPSRLSCAEEPHGVVEQFYYFWGVLPTIHEGLNWMRDRQVPEFKHDVVEAIVPGSRCYVKLQGKKKDVRLL